MGKNAFRRCVICKKMEYNIDEKLFYASFPLDEKRCKDWLKLVGNPELVYLPIEKLNRVRYICGDHFIKKHFNKKGNRLKKSAIPMLNLTLPPLTDQQLIEFPFHIHSDRKERIPGDVASTSRAALLSDNVNPKDVLSVAKFVNNDNSTFRAIKKNVSSKASTSKDLNIRVPIDHDYCLIEKYNPPVDSRVKKAGSLVEDRDTNGNPDEFNAGLSNNEKDAANTGESNANKKTELDIRKSRSFDPNPYAEGIPDFDDYDDKEPSFQNLQGSKTAQDPVFSWEKTVEVVPADDGDSVACLEMEALEDLPTEISLYCDDDSTPAKLDSDKAPEYQCNECREVITGFRYTCVQCADWDLCAACEARAAHDTHYVLRVPGQRPYSEIQAVLAAIRQQILSENLFLNPVDDSLKMEIKMEPDDSPPGPENGPPTDLEVLPDLDPLPVPDPLGEQRPDSENSFTDSSEESDSDADSQIRTGTPDGSTQTEQPQTISSDDSDGSHSPLRKRMRIPNITYEKATLRRMQPVKVQENQPRPSNVEIQARGSIVTKYSQLTKVYPHQIPQKLLANIPVTGESPAKHPYPVTVFETHPRYYQRGKSSKQPVRIQPNPASLLIQAQRVKFVEPAQSVAHQKPGTFVPQVLQRGGPRKRATENPLGSTQDPIMQRTDHQRQVVASEPTEEPRKSSEQLLSEQPEFYLRLPPDTNEESLIQALQCPVSVRLKRDF